MTVLKEYDGSNWVPIVVGKQGPQGPQGPQGSSSIDYDDIDNILAHQVFS